MSTSHQLTLWTLSSEVSRARTSAEQGSVPVCPAPVLDSGGSLLEPFAWYDPSSSTWKTWARDGAGISETYSGTWSSSGTVQGGIAWKRVMSEPRNSGIGASFWATPTATNYGSSQNGFKRNQPSGGTPSLENMAREFHQREDLWPTSLAVDAKDLAQSQEYQDDPKNGASLLTMVRGFHRRADLWPTATTTDAKDSARHTTTSEVMHPGTMLLDEVRNFHSRPDLEPLPKSGGSGSHAVVLRPEFVETHMGIPVGWTHDDGSTDFTSLAMPWSQRKRKPPSGG